MQTGAGFLFHQEGIHLSEHESDIDGGTVHPGHQQRLKEVPSNDACTESRGQLVDESVAAVGPLRWTKRGG